MTPRMPTYLKYLGGLYRLASDVEPLVSIPSDAIKVRLPDVRQRTTYSCGASCLQSVARYFGVATTENEGYFVQLTEMDSRDSSYPQILTAVDKLGLDSSYREGMSDDELRSYLEKQTPVLMALQAYGDNHTSTRMDYSHTWAEGHWVVAIGFDDTGVFFEDPVLEAIRGYLSYADLDARWHDTTQFGKRTSRIGVALWLDQSPSVPFYESFAQRIP